MTAENAASAGTFQSPSATTGMMTGSPHFAVSVIDLHFATDGEEPKRVLEAGIAKSATNTNDGMEGDGRTAAKHGKYAKYVVQYRHQNQPERSLNSELACLPIPRLTHSQVVHDVDILLFLSKKFSVPTSFNSHHLRQPGA